MPAPAALIASTTFKFGFAASTGGSTDTHEVCQLRIGDTSNVTTACNQAAATRPAATVVAAAQADLHGLTTQQFETTTYAGGE